MACRNCASHGYSGTKTCPSCNGRGKDSYDYTCPNCGGSGQVCIMCGGQNERSAVAAVGVVLASLLARIGSRAAPAQC